MVNTRSFQKQECTIGRRLSFKLMYSARKGGVYLPGFEVDGKVPKYLKLSCVLKPRAPQALPRKA